MEEAETRGVRFPTGSAAVCTQSDGHMRTNMNCAIASFAAVGWIAMLAGCDGSLINGDLISIGNAALVEKTIPEPAKPHSFSGITPSTHIEPATARDYLPGTGEIGPDGSYRYSLPLDVPSGRGDVRKTASA